MYKLGKPLFGIMLLAILVFTIPVQAKASDVAVTSENFIHADSTRAFLKELDQSKGKVNVLRPVREMTNADNQDVIRMNSDTLYTRAILDVKGGASITSKEYGGFQNIDVLDINHSAIASLTGHGTLEIDESMLTEGHYVYVLVRTGLLRSLPETEMMAEAHKAQDNISLAFKSSEPFVPSVNYDYESLEIIKYGILKEFAVNPKKDIVENGLGTLAERDPESARVVVAVGWGGLAGKQAVYAPFAGTGDRETFTLTSKPNSYDTGFFSFTAYNADGYIATINYSINSDDMTPNNDGSYTITFLASGEPVKEGDKNIVRTPRGKSWQGVLRSYNIKDKDEGFIWVNSVAAKMNEAFKH
jgi:hypothetical protein